VTKQSQTDKPESEAPDAFQMLRDDIAALRRELNEALQNFGNLASQLDRLNSKVFPSDLKPGDIGNKAEN
jgi:hypothetical protein